eukprot:6197636-Pleurochrysis_carterae.AAC.2
MRLSCLGPIRRKLAVTFTPSQAGMQSIGVLWGANGKAALEGEFDVLVDDVPALVEALRHLLGDA